ncbi:MAG: AAA family ATPase [Acidimicrobiales bacterium]
MRPLRLEMKGFGPFREPTVVDFTDVDLVALVGPTGAGKSSIIDAITFALYGSVVRYDDRSAVAPAVNQLSTEARVMLDFEVEGTEYRAVRVVRRTAGGASTREARLERGDTVLAGRATEMGSAIESLLGLDVDRFNRTVVLPQGRFASFLHDRPGDRQEVLRQLLDLSVYTRMGAAARDSARTAQAKLDVLEPLRGDIPTDDDIAELRCNAVAIAEAAETVRRRVEEHDVAAAALEESSQEAHDLGVLALAFAGVAVPDVVHELGDAHAAAEAAHDAASVALADARAALEAATLAVEGGPNAEVARGLLADRAELARSLEVLAEQRRALDDAEATLTATTVAADAARARLQALDEAAELAREALDETRQAQDDGPDAAALTAVARRREDLASAEAAVADLAAQVEAATAAHQAAVDAHAAREQEVAAAAAVLDAARVAAGAAGMLAGVDIGDPCPVCRRVIDELPDHDVDAELAAAVEHHERAVAALAEARRVLDGALGARSVAEADHRSACEAVRRLTEDLAGAPDQQAIDDGIAVAALLAAATAAAATARTEVEAARRAGRSDPAVADRLAAEREAAAAADELRSRHDRTAALVESHRTRLADAPDEATLQRDIEAAEALSAARERARDAASEAERVAAQSAGELRVVVEREADARRALGETRDRFVALGAPAIEGSLVEAWSTLALWAQDRAVEALDAHRRGLDEAATARRVLDDAADEIRALASPWLPPVATDQAAGDDAVVGDGGADAHPGEGAVGRDDADSGEGAPLGQVRDALAEAATRAQVAVDHAVERRAEAQRRDAEIAALRVQADVDGELGRLLDARGFERWLMAEAVEDLVARATERLLELSRGQYSLVAHDTDFRICDHRNADELRDAKTLSGGETFLASLALALALAESIAELAADGTPGMGSLFLDEGFGTLDPETLDVVAGAIEELGASGRMVGVVTHIRDLAERMPVRFEVTKGPTTSTVERVAGP